MYHNLSSDEILVSTSKKKKIENCRSYMVPLMHESREILTILSASAQKSNPKEGSFSILVTSSSWYYIFTTITLPLPVFLHKSLKIL